MPHINFDNFIGDIVVVHGDNDRHGSIFDVENNLSKSQSSSKKVIKISGADHSFNKEDIKENEAISSAYSV
jgi:alpha/beta superfamily hydrolase